jgi:hypothetical protein
VRVYQAFPGGELRGRLPGPAGVTPSLGPLLAYQFALDLGYSPLLTADEATFVVPGPGALDGLAKCFEDPGGLAPEDLIR